MVRVVAIADGDISQRACGNQLGYVLIIFRLGKLVLKNGSGNFGKALASAAYDLGVRRDTKIPISIVMPSTSRTSKIMATKALGATVYLSGPSWSEREDVVNALQKSTGASCVSTVNNPDILLGQGYVR